MPRDHLPSRGAAARSWPCALAVVLGLLLLAPSTATTSGGQSARASAEDSASPKPLPPAAVVGSQEVAQSPGSGDVVVLSTLEGDVVGLDVRTGAIKFAARLGEPAVRAHVALDDNETLPFRLVPGHDGSVYLLGVQPGSTLQKLDFTIKDAVASSPYGIGDGLILLGTKLTKVYGISPSDGSIRFAFSSTDNKEDVCLNDWRPGTITMGHVRYSVRAVDSRTGRERWNLTLSEFVPILHDPAASVQQAGDPLSSGRLLVARDNTVYFIDDSGGEPRWRLHLPAPAMRAFGVSGDGARSFPLDLRRLALEEANVAVPGQSAGEFLSLPSGAGDVSMLELVTLQNQAVALPALRSEECPHDLETRAVAHGIPSHRLQLAPHQPLPLLPVVPPSSTAAAQPPEQQLPQHNEHQSELYKLFTIERLFILAVTASVLIVVAGSLMLSRRMRQRAAVVTVHDDERQLLISADAGAEPPASGPGGVEQTLGPAAPAPKKKKRGKKASAPASAETLAAEPHLSPEPPRGDTLQEEGGALAVAPPLGPPPVAEADGWIRVGRLLVSSRILGYGSHGTVVYEGELDGRQVAVKRMLPHFFNAAQREISLLIQADHHPNVVRYYGLEADNQFVYLALERCARTLADYVEEARSSQGRQSALPSGETRRVLGELVQGVAFLHAMHIVHRDIKPVNVLLTETGMLKISDMGLSRRLQAHETSYESCTPGTSGWQAPEVLLAGRLTKAVDIFSTGCLLHYVLTFAGHPFGERMEREANVVAGRADLSGVAHLPEAQHLIRAMLHPEPGCRPTAGEVVAHPFFWGDEQRLAFLVDASDRIEPEERDSPLLRALEARAAAVLGPAPDWVALLDPELVANLGKYRKYNPASLRDLLRVIRNKRNHFRDMPPPLQALMGPLPGGFLHYFASRFPTLLLHVYDALRVPCHADPHLAQYF
eukprot:tig00001416_g8952.t1